MRAHVMTRGMSRDYAFLGSLPGESWWQEYAQLTAFEQPSLLVNADETGWRLYASAIPSLRHDRMNTQIRFTLVLDGDRESSQDDLGAVAELVRSWLAEPAPAASDRLITLLDKYFPAEDTERFLKAAGPANDDEVQSRIRHVLEQLAAESEPAVAESGPAGSWVGDVSDQDACRAFVRRVESLLTSQGGWAVQLNLAGTGDVLRHFEDSPEPLVALVDERITAGRIELAPKAVAPPTAHSRRAALVIAAVLLAGIVGVAAWILSHAGARPEQPHPPAVPVSTSTSTRRTGHRGSFASWSRPSAFAVSRSRGLRKAAGWLVPRLRDSCPSVRPAFPPLRRRKSNSSSTSVITE